MNVIKYDVEITKRNYNWNPFKKKDETAIKLVLSDKFKKASNFDGDYDEILKKEWDKLEHQDIKSLNSSNFLLGYYTVKGSKVFIFEIKNEGLSGNDYLTIQIFAFGSIPIEEILNGSYNRLKTIIKNLKCTLIDHSHILIYPYNTSTNDIESPDLKIKAKINSFIVAKKLDYYKWAIILVISFGSFIWHKTIEGETDFKKLLFNFFVAGLFYFTVDILVTLIIPWVFNRNKKTVSIEVLSSVIDTPDNISEKITETRNLTIPE